MVAASLLRRPKPDCFWGLVGLGCSWTGAAEAVILVPFPEPVTPQLYLHLPVVPSEVLPAPSVRQQPGAGRRTPLSQFAKSLLAASAEQRPTAGTGFTLDAR